MPAATHAPPAGAAAPAAGAGPVRPADLLPGGPRLYLTVRRHGRPMLVASRDRDVLRYLAGAVLSVPPGAGPVASVALTGAVRVAGRPYARRLRGPLPAVSLGRAPAPARVELDDLLRQPGVRALYLCLSTDPNAKSTLLLFPAGAAHPAYAVKIPSTPAAAARVEAEAAALRRLATDDLGPLAATVPRVLGDAEQGGIPALWTTAMPGQNMLTRYHLWGHTARPGAVAQDFAVASGWLDGLAERTGGPRADLASILDGVPQALGERFGGDPDVDDDLDALSRLRARLAGHAVATGRVHGDFWPGNVLLAAGAVSGVVDWEAAGEQGVPVRDLARFAVAYSLYLDRHTRPGRPVAGHPGLRAGRWGAGLDYLVDGQGWYPGIARGAVARALSRAGSPAFLARDVLLAEIACVAAEADHPDFARAHLQAWRRLTGRA